MAYEPNTWNTGDTITSEKLNHMEQGVSAASAAAEAATQAAQAASAAAKTAATTSTAGVVKQIPHMEALSAEPTQSDFNSLLTALQSAGVMAAE